jgi:hypothetical protein
VPPDRGPRDETTREQCTGLRRNDDSIGVLRPDRFYSERVARYHEVLASVVPQRKAENPVQPADTVQAPLLVGMNNYLGIGARGEAVPHGLRAPL